MRPSSGDKGFSAPEVMALMLGLILISIVVTNLSSPKVVKEISLIEAEDDFNNTIRAVTKSLMLNSDEGRLKVSIRNYLPIRGVGSDRNKFFFIEYADPTTGSVYGYGDSRAATVSKTVLAGVDIDLLSSRRDGRLDYNIQRRTFVNSGFTEVLFPALTVSKMSAISGNGLYYAIPDVLYNTRYASQDVSGLLIPNSYDTYVSIVEKNSF